MFDDIIKFFGNQQTLADLLEIDKAAVSQWAEDGIPPLRAIQIERLSGGKFKAINIVRLKRCKN